MTLFLLVIDDWVGRYNHYFSKGHLLYSSPSQVITCQYNLGHHIYIFSNKTPNLEDMRLKTKSVPFKGMQWIPCMCILWIQKVYCVSCMSVVCNSSCSEQKKCHVQQEEWSVMPGREMKVTLVFKTVDIISTDQSIKKVLIKKWSKT